MPKFVSCPFRKPTLRSRFAICWLPRENPMVYRPRFILLLFFEYVKEVTKLLVSHTGSTEGPYRLTFSSVMSIPLFLPCGSQGALSWSLRGPFMNISPTRCRDA